MSESHLDDQRPERPGARPRTFAGRLNRLVAVKHDPGTRPLSNREIAARTGGVVSPSYIGDLRNVKRTINPSLHVAERLAAVFGESVDYFVGDDPGVDERLDALARLHADHALREIDASVIAGRQRAAQFGPRVEAELRQLLASHLAALESQSTEADVRHIE